MVGVTEAAAKAAEQTRNKTDDVPGMPFIIECSDCAFRAWAGQGPPDRGSMRTIPGWDQYYLDICKVVAARSKDPNTQIGCVIIGPNREIRSTGYNSFPRGIRDDVPERLVRPTKYLWIEHAERNAICNAARAGTATEGCTIFVEIMPCMDCARAVVQAGIVEVVVSAERMAQYSSEYYNEHFGMVEVLFSEAGTRVRRV
jgi:dCMP deaminase